MKDNLNYARWMSLLMGILLICSGIIFYMYPITSLVSMAYMIACIFIVVGAVRIVRYFTHTTFRTGAFLVQGILEIILGILMLYTQGITVITLAMFLGFWEIFSGTSEIANSFDLKKNEFKGWWLGIISGLIGISLGFMLIGDPALSSILIGMYALIYGFTYILSFFNISYILKNK
ncbi:HdeD family acid-resistance protein [Peptostreptococcus faecalis]|uniref:HdeD family acid-resistance protein n=1 Tax=Peptostreptococcus faecalis TaxID=2045015 RepID=UPI000C7D892D|nr:DUF308 domain-containing protein [Peptostreptococcus faecalis]